ncbi:unnamed protein product [Heligmosomoides polygyrus]|uniref:RRP7 domain-containing protein n=1 Tax=Heligmosomoides polygyrus TaxID=6339 RepID=A0A183GGB4_HELPZ|nr:unnamed protein product [Heligmosomoides polygyrus]
MPLLTAIEDSMEAPVVRLPCIVGEQGSSKLDRGQVQKKPVNNGVPAFQVFEDDGDNADHYLEDIFEMDNHIERFSLNDHDAEKWKASKVPLKKLANCVSTFTVWQDDEANKENEHMAKLFESSEDKEEMKKVARKINFDDD